MWFMTCLDADVSFSAQILKQWCFLEHKKVTVIFEVPVLIYHLH